MSGMPTSTADPVADLRNAADLIREQHRSPADPLWTFWNQTASLYNREAERADAGAIKDIGTWNGIVRAARNYLDANGGQR